MQATAKVTSRDGTSIAFERTGRGPALIAVDAAGSYRDFRPQRPPVELLAERFTVYTYDRRGRGQSTDTLPYAVEREVEDLAALIDEAGGRAFVYGMSSGGLLALHAAAAGLAIPRMALLETPIEPTEEPAGRSEFTAELAELVAAGRRREAVAYFDRGVGVPEELLAELPEPVRAAREAVAHTLVYDAILSDTMSLPLLRSVTTPTLVIDSEASGELTAMTDPLVAALPNATHRRLPGTWHGVADEALAPALVEFFRP
jgi:pimeloyl-ACP methyl ester carboxylesterase